MRVPGMGVAGLCARFAPTISGIAYRCEGPPLASIFGKILKDTWCIIFIKIE